MKLAIVIGISEYKFDNLPNLPACKNDADLFNKVLNNVKAIDDALYINTKHTCHEMKSKIFDFISKHKSNEIDELVFYFSGHGDRFDEDFHYLCYDFEMSKKSTTSISNSLLDSLIRNLSPKLCIKIVDACYSGTHYVKNSVNETATLEASAKKSKINDLYFLFSSREDKESEAGVEFSYFTESLFTALLEREGDFKYNDVMSYIADDLENRGAPKPIFIAQATYLENFGTITKDTHDIINSAFGLTSESPVDKKDKMEPSTFYNLVKSKSEKLYCNQETAIKNLTTLINTLTNSSWPDDITSVFNVEINMLSASSVPNRKAIGEWINNNEGLKLFCSTEKEIEEYSTQEYVEVPTKPVNRNIWSSERLIEHIISGQLTRREKEYKLEKVTKKRHVIVGFDYPHNLGFENNVFRIDLKPKFESAENAVIYIVLLYSKTKLCIHYSYETLKNTSWNTVSNAKCLHWRNKIINLNDPKVIASLSYNIVKEVSDWLIDETKKNIKDL